MRFNPKEAEITVQPRNIIRIFSIQRLKWIRMKLRKFNGLAETILIL